MTREEAIQKLKEQQADNDPEAEHYRADRVLCDLLKSLGYKDVVNEWCKVHKWYG